MSAGPKADKHPLKAGDHLYLIDGSGYLFRAYHALPPLTRKSDGLPTGVQLAGKPLCEDTLLQLAAQLEAAHPWAHLRP